MIFTKIIRGFIRVMRALRKGRPQHFIMVIPGRNAPGKQSF
nr:hypothetical protein [Escherichia coli]